MTASQAVDAAVGEAIRQVVPLWLVPVVIAITHLGNVIFLLSLFTLDYWFGDHERGAHALGLILAGMALITALKAFFAAPRPPEGARLVAAGGFSFPSGHAVISTIGYGALAFDLRAGTRRTRYGAAGVLVVLIALSRVVLGVHFVRDIVAGVVVGLVFLLVAESITGHAPRPGFLLAAGLGIGALLLGGMNADSMAEFGAILGAAVAWESVDEIPSVESSREHLLLLAGGLPVFVGISYLSLFSDLPPPAVFLLNAVLLAGVVISPSLVVRRR